MLNVKPLKTYCSFFFFVCEGDGRHYIQPYRHREGRGHHGATKGLSYASRCY